MTRGRFAEAAQAFVRIMPEQREAVLQIAPMREIKVLESADAPAKPGIAILFLAPIELYGAGRRSLVLDGYRHLWRRTLHSDYPRRDRCLR